MNWKITTASLYDKNIAFENTHAVPVIDTNRTMGIVKDRLTYNRKCGIELRKRESSSYKLRWKI
jgi:hypothetical protein